MPLSEALRAVEQLPGRTQEGRLLVDALETARTGGPQVVMVTGAAGMGKTVLVEWFLRRHCGDLPTRLVICDRFEADVAFGVAGLVTDTVPEPDTAVSVVGQQILVAVSALEQIGSPAVVVVEDAHWMDQPSVAALRFALRRLRRDSVLVVLTRRPPEAEDPWGSVLADRRLTTDVRLRQFASTTIREVARLVGSVEIDTGAAEDIAARTGGLPLVVAAVLADQSREADRGDASGRSATTPDRPSSAADAAWAMRASLGAEARRLVDCLAVWGERTTLVPLATMASLEEPSVALAAAVDSGLVGLDRQGGWIGFSHAALRDGVYEQLDPTRRRVLHQAAASLTTGGRQLEHRVAATEHDDPSLAALLIDAAAREVQTGRHAVAARRLLDARSVTADPAARETLLLQGLQQRLVARDLAAAGELEDEARALDASPLRDLTLGMLARDRGQMREAEQLLRGAIDAASVQGEVRLAAEASNELGALFVMLGRGRDAARVAEAAPQQTHAEAAAQTRLVHSMGVWQAGDVRGALDELADVDDLDVPAAVKGELLAARGLIRPYNADLSGALDDLNRALGVVQTTRASLTLDRVNIGLAWVLFEVGEWDTASVVAASALALAESGDRPTTLAPAHAFSSLVPAARGEFDVARKHLDLAVRYGQQIPSFASSLLTDLALVGLAAARGDFNAVLAVTGPLRESDHFDALVGMGSGRWVMTAHVEALVRLSRHDQAAAELDAYAEMSARAPWGIGPVRRHFLTGLLAEGRGAPKLARAEYAAELDDPVVGQVPYARASTLLQAGRLERAVGNRRAAIEHLRQAHTILEKLRAAPLLSVCADELTACGLQQRTSSPIQLTAREKDVAALVAQGLSNNEAAAQLFLTPKTIEYHLANIYAKLGVTGRRELRSALNSRQDD